jgi:hypothetical protein
VSGHLHFLLPTIAFENCHEHCSPSNVSLPLAFTDFHADVDITARDEKSAVAPSRPLKTSLPLKGMCVVYFVHYLPTVSHYVAAQGSSRASFRPLRIPSLIVCSTLVAIPLVLVAVWYMPLAYRFSALEMQNSASRVATKISAPFVPVCVRSEISSQTFLTDAHPRLTLRLRYP